MRKPVFIRQIKGRQFIVPKTNHGPHPKYSPACLVTRQWILMPCRGGELSSIEPGSGGLRVFKKSPLMIVETHMYKKTPYISSKILFPCCLPTILLSSASKPNKRWELHRPTGLTSWRSPHTFMEAQNVPAEKRCSNNLPLTMKPQRSRMTGP